MTGHDGRRAMHRPEGRRKAARRSLPLLAVLLLIVFSCSLLGAAAPA